LRFFFFPDAKFKPAAKHALTQPMTSAEGARSVLPVRWGRSDSCLSSPTTRHHPAKPTRCAFFISCILSLLACCLIAPHRGNNTRSALAAGGQVPRGTVARPTCVCCQCVSCSGLSQAVMGSLSFRFHALAVVLTYPRPLGRSQCLKQRPTLLLFTTITPTLVHSHLLQTPVPTHFTCC
jgi:hypothetical protein